MSWCTVLLSEAEASLQPAKTFPNFMGLEGSSSCSQEPANCPCLSQMTPVQAMQHSIRPLFMYRVLDTQTTGNLPLCYTPTHLPSLPTVHYNLSIFLYHAPNLTSTDSIYFNNNINLLKTTPQLYVLTYGNRDILPPQQVGNLDTQFQYRYAVYLLAVFQCRGF